MSVLTKKYLLVRQDTAGPVGEQLKKKFNIASGCLVILSPEEKVLARLINTPSPLEVFKMVEGIPENQSGKEELEKLKEKGITKSNVVAAGTALKKIGALQSKDAQATIMEYASKDDGPEGLQAAAIKALYRQPAAAKELAGWLNDKRAPIKEAAKTALIGMELSALPVLFEELGSSEVDRRANAFSVAAAITKSNKITRDVAFWRTAKTEARDKALDEWKKWHKLRTDPKEKS